MGTCKVSIYWKDGTVLEDSYDNSSDFQSSIGYAVQLFYDVNHKYHSDVSGVEILFSDGTIKVIGDIS